MIALLDGMPLVTLPDGRSIRFEKRWIIASLVASAERAGYRRWWLAEHIAESVSLYLRRDFAATSVGIVNLRDAVLEVLESLGFNDVATQFRLPDPPELLSLEDLVHEAGTGYELAFFGLLEQRLKKVAQSSVAELEIRDLNPCLRILAKRRRSHLKNTLRGEIVEFIRQFGALAGNSRSGDPLDIRLT
jgi:hypothetical protein